MTIFWTFSELHFSGLKRILFYPEYHKMFLSGFFCSKNLFKKKKSIFWQNPWTNPFAKCRFFYLARTLLLRSKKLYFLSRISKNVSFWLFLLKKKTYKKKVDFWQKPRTIPFAKCRFFSTLWELHFWGPKSFIFYPEYQKMFLLGFLLKKKLVRKSSIFGQKPWTNPFAKCRFFWLC